MLYLLAYSIFWVNTINPTLNNNFVNDIHAEYCLPTGNVHGILNKVGYQTMHLY